jgi:glycosyltransferase involved in cell wall biosynthesis
MVSIKCLAYNHAPYIRQALEGFVMQKTNFRFEAIVHDDASTDGTADIIREYAEKYPEIIKPIYEKENQYSKGVGSIRRITNFVIRGKYVALCEGDDYWINPNKLQMQVDFMEAHPDYSLVFTNNLALCPNGKMSIRHTNKGDCDVPIKDVILKDGSFIATASICCRGDIYMHLPKEVRSQYVGDFPLQIYLAHVGKVRYFNDIMVVYRAFREGSWTATHCLNPSLDVRKKRAENELKLVRDMDVVTNYKHTKIFKKYLNNFFWSYYHDIGDLKNERKYFFKLKHPMQGYSFKAYVYLLLKYTHMLKWIN